MSDQVKVSPAQRAKIMQELKDAGFVLVDSEEHAAMQATAEQLQRDIAEAEWKKAEAVVDAAIQARKLRRAQRDQYLKLMAVDPEGTADVLASLPPTAVPGPPLGTDEDLTVLSDRPSRRGIASRGTSGEGTGLFPKLEARRA